MKKFIAIAIVGMFGVMTLGSCKKDYTCECTVTSAGMTATVSATENGKKKDLKEKCEKDNVSTSEQTVNCKLK